MKTNMWYCTLDSELMYCAIEMLDTDREMENFEVFRFVKTRNFVVRRK